jgi:hypothetical protein
VGANILEVHAKTGQNLKMVVAGSSAALVPMYKSAQCHIKYEYSPPRICPEVNLY